MLCTLLHSVHQILRVLAERARKLGCHPRDLLDEVVEAELHLPSRSAAATAGVADSVKGFLGRYLDAWGDDLLKVHEAESRLEFTLRDRERAAVLARVDVLLGDPSDSLTVVDFKTASDDDVTPQAARLQILLYGLGLARTGRRVLKGRIDQVVTGVVTPIDLDDDGMRVAEDLARASTEGMAAREFPPKPEAAAICKRYDVRRICSASAAGA